MKDYITLSEAAESPSAKKVWIEIKMESGMKKRFHVTFCEEGVD